MFFHHRRERKDAETDQERDARLRAMRITDRMTRATTTSDAYKAT